MQVIDSKGGIVDPHSLAWKKFTKANFPYRFRQSTGCDNALGVLKFNLTSPYNVYLHDTNIKSDFIMESRYFSHGCIRIQKPAELANSFLDKPLDETFLRANLRNQNPVTKKVKKNVPVFVLYMPAGSKNGKVSYHPDIYGLLL